MDKGSVSMLMDLVRNAGCDASSPFDLQSKVQERFTCRSRRGGWTWVRERTPCSSDLGYPPIHQALPPPHEPPLLPPHQPPAPPPPPPPPPSRTPPPPS